MDLFPLPTDLQALRSFDAVSTKVGSGPKPDQLAGRRLPRTRTVWLTSGLPNKGNQDTPRTGAPVSIQIVRAGARRTRSPPAVPLMHYG